MWNIESSNQLNRSEISTRVIIAQRPTSTPLEKCSKKFEIIFCSRLNWTSAIRCVVQLFFSLSARESIKNVSELMLLMHSMMLQQLALINLTNSRSFISPRDISCGRKMNTQQHRGERIETSSNMLT